MTSEARAEYILQLKRSAVPWDETELCLALLWQRCAKSPGLSAAFSAAYETLVKGGYDDTFKFAEDIALGVERYCLNVRLDIKEDRLEDFKKAIAINEAGTRKEYKNIRYSFGESTTDKNSFHFQEQFCGQAGFNLHAASAHFAVWESFVQTDPFTAPPKVEFWKATTNLAHEEPPCVVAAAVLACLDFVEDGI